ncbi:MAG TPA: 5'-methylthioadenosine/S-adenosylhomocysteine nucleosidase [Bordetella sp.]
MAGALAACLLLAGCSSLPPSDAGQPAAASESRWLDATPRIAVVSAFAPELALLTSRLDHARTYRVNGVQFSAGLLQGKPVLLFLSGVSMTNAAMNTQLALDRFRVSHLVFSGIAGGVNPALHIGDVAVPAQWGPYLEATMARETAPGKFTPPAWQKDFTAPPFGMLYPRPVEVRSAAQPDLHKKFWFEVDPVLLDRARALSDAVRLNRCAATGTGGQTCLAHEPRLVVGGNGVSGSAFVDNKALREYAFRRFKTDVLDMETAAVGQVAYANGVPFIAFRSLSDLAGGGEGENEMDTFMKIAADNAAEVLLAFLGAWR